MDSLLQKNEWNVNLQPHFSSSLPATKVGPIYVNIKSALILRKRAKKSVEYGKQAFMSTVSSDFQ